MHNSRSAHLSAHACFKMHDRNEEASPPPARHAALTHGVAHGYLVPSVPCVCPELIVLHCVGFAQVASGWLDDLGGPAGPNETSTSAKSCDSPCVHQAGGLRRGDHTMELPSKNQRSTTLAFAFQPVCLGVMR